MKTITVNFPNKTAKEIMDDCRNKLGKGKLLHDTSWYKDEDFFTKEKCRKGKREINVELECIRKSWNECKEHGEVLNFAELLYVITKHNFLKDWVYSWTSSRTSDGDFVYAGYFDDDGGIVNRSRPGNTNSYSICCVFSAVKLGNSPIDTLNSDDASSIGAMEKRIKKLEKWASGFNKD